MMGFYGVIQGMKVVTLAVFWGGFPASKADMATIGLPLS